MKTAQEMIQIMDDAQARMREASKPNAQLAVEKYLLPHMHERANDGYRYAAISLKGLVYEDRALDDYYVRLVENPKNKKSTIYKVYIYDMTDYLKEQGYYTRWEPWSGCLTVVWKPKEEK